MSCTLALKMGFPGRQWRALTRLKSSLHWVHSRMRLVHEQTNQQKALNPGWFCSWFPAGLGWSLALGGSLPRGCPQHRRRGARRDAPALQGPAGATCGSTGRESTDEFVISQLAEMPANASAPPHHSSSVLL